MLNILEQEDKYAPAKGELTTFFRPYILHGICAWINTNVSFSTQHYSVIEKKINDFLRSIRKDVEEIIGMMVEDETIYFWLRKGLKMGEISVAPVLFREISGRLFRTNWRKYQKRDTHTPLLMKLEISSWLLDIIRSIGCVYTKRGTLQSSRKLYQPFTICEQTTMLKSCGTLCMGK